MWGFGVGSLFCGVVLCALSSLAVILLRKRELVDFLLLCCRLSVLCISSSWCRGLVGSLHDYTGLSYPILGMGPRPMELGKLAAFWLKLGNLTSSLCMIARLIPIIKLTFFS